MKFGFTPEAEILNARLAMLGFVIAVGTYITTLVAVCCQLECQGLVSGI